MIKSNYMEFERQLIIIPSAHTYADMGTLRDRIPHDEGYEAAVTKYWAEVFRYLHGLGKKVTHVKVYQDGLPNTSIDLIGKIIDETKGANYEILRWLRQQGANILGTEDPNLLKEEYQSLHAITASQNDLAKVEYLKKSSLILEERDDYIARRIKNTLHNGETGILFIGVAHNVGQLLPEDMQISEPEKITHFLPESLRSSYGLGKERE